MKKLAIVGHFGEGKNLLNGQTIKTKILTEQLIETFGEEEIIKIDSSGGKKALIPLFFKVFSAMRKCKNIIILPAHNGLRFFVPILSFFNRFFKRKLFYVVIGGWLPQYLKKRERLRRKLKRFDGIYVETKAMEKALTANGFDNIQVMPNCKKLEILSTDNLVYPKGEPYKLCTFSRVMKEKGIEDAVEVVKFVNEKSGRVVYALDIYGQIEIGQEAWFENLQKDFPPYIQYKGSVSFDKSVETLKNYFALLFPTHYFREGIPGTILDAYAAGIPVISARWENFSDIIEENITGHGYDFDDFSQLIKCLNEVASDADSFLQMKEDCLYASRKYLPEEVTKQLVCRLK